MGREAKGFYHFKGSGRVQNVSEQQFSTFVAHLLVINDQSLNITVLESIHIYQYTIICTLLGHK